MPSGSAKPAYRLDTIPAITAGEPVRTPPRWAVLERQLISAMNATASVVLEKYLQADGSLLWPPDETGFQSIDALDDAYESFHNWPLFYLLGGDAAFLTHSHREFEAITAQFERYPTGQGYPMVVKEYQPAYDWFHQGEGNYLFYMLSMADPGNPLTVERARRFAGLYLDEDPDAPNYDPELRIIRCAHNGSMGPAYRNFGGSSIWTLEGYGLPFWDVPGCDNVDDLGTPACMRRMARASYERRGRGDTTANLAATSLVTNAYLLTGEAKYRDWVAVYVDAWIDRTSVNGGVVPDNVGLSGKVGEYTGGKWYGGNYGWTWPHGWDSLGQAVAIAAENARLLWRDERYPEFLRGQLNMLASHGIEYDGTLHIPLKYGDPGRVRYRPWDWLAPLEDDAGYVLERDGWHEFLPMRPFFLSHLWAITADPGDLLWATRFRGYGRHDWLRLSTRYAKDNGGNDGPWMAYLLGEYPDYPEEILEHNLRQVADRMAFIEADDEPASSYGDAYLQLRNPITCEGLVQLTLGGPLPIYNGGLLLARVRYYDVAARRPGLPEDVAALVSGVERDRTVLELVNLCPTAAREVAIQAGSMGQHRFGAAVVDAATTRCRKIAVDASMVRVQLPPRSRIALDLETICSANDPSYGGVSYA